MAIGVWLFVGWMAVVALIAFGMFVWGIEHDQFTHLEEPARRMLRDDDAPPRPPDQNGNGTKRGDSRDR